MIGRLRGPEKLSRPASWAAFSEVLCVRPASAGVFRQPRESHVVRNLRDTFAHLQQLEVQFDRIRKGLIVLEQLDEVQRIVDGVLRMATSVRQRPAQ
jgi:hypothetical protein